MNGVTILNTIDDGNSGERVVVALSSAPGDRSRLMLIQQSYSESVGWYNQNTIDLNPQQADQLQQVLGDRRIAQHNQAGPTPAVIKFPVRQIA